VCLSYEAVDPHHLSVKKKHEGFNQPLSKDEARAIAREDVYQEGEVFVAQLVQTRAELPVEPGPLPVHWIQEENEKASCRILCECCRAEQRVDALRNGAVELSEDA